MGKQNNVKFILQPQITNMTLSVRRTPIEEYPGKFSYSATGSVAVTAKLLDTTSGQIMFQTTQDATLDSGNEVGKMTSGPSDNTSVAVAAWRAMAKDAASKLTSAIDGYVFPLLEVMQAQADDIFVNRGEGSGIAVGDIYQIFSVGEALIDPVTKDSLGAAEALLGEVQVARVNPRFSVVKAIAPLAGPVKRGDILRPRPR
jgi:hypothetical protein